MKITNPLKKLKPSSSSSSSSNNSNSNRAKGKQLLKSPTSSLSSSASSSGDPKISRRDLERILRRLGPHPPTDDEILTMLAEADRDGHGCISFDEIAALGRLAGSRVDDEYSSEMEETFRVFDADGDGKISAEELLEMVGDEECGIEECRRMIRVVDSDGDGFVCFRDFVKMMDLRA